MNYCNCCLGTTERGLMETPEIKEILRVLGKTTAEIPRRETFHHRILAQCGSSIVTEPLCASRRDETKCFCCRGSLGSRAVSHPLWKSDRICVKCQQLPRCVACERRSSPRQDLFSFDD